jgi:antibiotic biosynthesis monooxygenase (ABM) superfamily enzyme
MTTITSAEKAKEARREVAMRRRVYPGWVSSGKLSPAAADRQIAVMQAIAEDYERQAMKEKPQGELL